MSFISRPEYEALVYSLVEEYDEVERSALYIYSTSASAGILQGDVFLRENLRIAVVEVLDFRVGRIRNYSYTVYHGEDKVRWYDPQPHPENQDLAETFPHHFHEEPDPSTSSGQSIKHNRKPAPGISFEALNLPTLIADCVKLGEERS